ncbi:hypothetical protein EJB05_45695, partial [Eragrostis curvula]
MYEILVTTKSNAATLHASDILIQCGIIILKCLVILKALVRPDEDITHADTNDTPPLVIQGPITRARARQLNLEEPWRGPEDVGRGNWRRRSSARASKSSWRPKSSRLRVGFGVQEHSALKRMPRSHTGSVLDVLHMDRKII